MGVDLYAGDCLDVLAGLPAESVDSVVTDPPYHFASIVKRFGDDGAASAKSSGATGVYRRASAGFMGKKWDGGDIAFRPETWAAVARVLKPGGHLLAFGAPKNAHRLFCAIEDAGFEIRDCVMWVFGTGFPKSLDVSKAIDKAAGVERRVVGTERVRDIRNGHGRDRGDGIHASNRDGPVYMERELTEPGSDEAAAWQGWGTALKPAYEPIVVARKPLIGTVAENVLAHGTGALNIDGCRVEGEPWKAHRATGLGSVKFFTEGETPIIDKEPHSLGRWPANIIHDGSDEVVGAFPNAPRQQGALTGDEPSPTFSGAVYGKMARSRASTPRGDTGSAARFFYSAKAGKADRAGSKHPTVKPVALMRYLCRLVTPPGGTVLDPFAGSGTTGQAAIAEGFNAILIEREAEYLADIRRRLDLDDPLTDWPDDLKDLVA